MTATRTPKLGDYVIDRHGHRGRVTGLHPWGCPMDDVWLEGQSIPSTHLKDAAWVSVLLEPAGAVVTPAESTMVVDPFPFTNSYGELYTPPQEETNDERADHRPER